MDVFVEAIKNRRLLRFHYHGLPRIVEPHAYGVSRRGARVLRCYQLAGGSVSAEPEGWKLMKVAEISGAALGEAFAAARPDYRRGDRHMLTILAEL
jgi:hypothetical protein